MHHRISLAFVHSHVGIDGNERADQAANAALSQDSIGSLDLDRRTAKALIDDYTRRLRIKTWEALSPSNKLKSHSLPSALGIFSFQNLAKETKQGSLA